MNLKRNGTVGVRTVGMVAALLTLGAAPAELGLPAEVAEYYTWERGNAQKSLAESAHPVAKDIYLDEAATQAARGASFPTPRAARS